MRDRRSWRRMRITADANRQLGFGDLGTDRPSSGWNTSKGAARAHFLDRKVSHG